MESTPTVPQEDGCQKGHLYVVRMLLSVDGIEPNRAQKEGATPLFLACQNGRLDVVRMLLSTEGIDTNRAEEDALESSDSCACVKLLIATANRAGHLDVSCACRRAHAVSTEGIEPNRAREDGCTPLYSVREGASGLTASTEGHLDVRAHAVECGWDRSESGHEGWSDPIVDSVSEGHVDVVRLLLLSLA